MCHAKNFANVASYRKESFDGLDDPSDRPLIVQFAGNDPDILVQAAQFVEHQVDAVDVNLGCPQKIAKRGCYGAYLLEDRSLIRRMVRTMVRELKAPVSVKIRLLPTEKDTLELVKMLEDEGCQLLTGRTRWGREVVDGQRW